MCGDYHLVPNLFAGVEKNNKAIYNGFWLVDNSGAWMCTALKKVTAMDGQRMLYVRLVFSMIIEIAECWRSDE